MRLLRELRACLTGRALFTRHDMWHRLTEAEPRFKPRRAAFLAEWQDDGEPLPEFLCISELADFTIECLAMGETEAVARILGVVEVWLADGDDDVKQLASVGFIEDLTNGARHATTQPNDFKPLLSAALHEEFEVIQEGWRRHRLRLEVKN